jgi:hypothetical protein
MSSLRNDEGSIPLVILVSIVVGGAVLALFLTVQSGMRSAERDRDFAAAIQVADAGLQEAFVELRALPEGGSPACDPSATGVCTGTLQDGSEFRWEYEQTASRMWTVTSYGIFGDSTRVVRASVGEAPLFGAAIVTDEEFTYNGSGNTASEFPVGGFKKMTFNGGNTGASITRLFLYGEDNEPTGSAPDPDKWERTPGPDLPNLGAEAFESGGVCHGESESLPNPLVRGETYCLTGGVNFKSDTPLTSEPAGEPVKIYVQSGGVSAGPTEINHPGDAVDLQILVGAGDVRFNGNFKVNAAIYAPKSACTSNGQGNGGFAGGMICNTVTLNGNMRYDPTIEAIVDDTFSIRGWSEQPQLSVEASG